MKPVLINIKPRNRYIHTDVPFIAIQSSGNFYLNKRAKSAIKINESTYFNFYMDEDKESVIYLEVNPTGKLHLMINPGVTNKIYGTSVELFRKLWGHFDLKSKGTLKFEFKKECNYDGTILFKFKVIQETLEELRIRPDKPEVIYKLNSYRDIERPAATVDIKPVLSKPKVIIEDPADVKGLSVFNQKTAYANHLGYKGYSEAIAAVTQHKFERDFKQWITTK